MGTVELQGLSHNRTIEVELLIAVLAVNLGSCNLTKPVIVWITGDDLISNEPGIDMGNFIADNNLLRDEDRLLELIKAIVDVWITAILFGFTWILSTGRAIDNVGANDEGAIGMDDGNSVIVAIALV